jgi:hypothetical protein
MKVGCVRLVLCLSLCLCSRPSAAQHPPDDSPISASFFGIHVQAGKPWPTVPVSARRVTFNWIQIEPKRGTWDFKTADSIVRETTAHNADLIVGLAFSPSWASSRPNGDCRVGKGGCWEPANIQDWRDFVRTVATRYKGQIHYYEIWNEPNEGAFYQSTVPALVSLAQSASAELKRIDSGIQVISPSPIGPKGMEWMDEFLKEGGGKYIDIVGFHFYFAPAPPESVFGEAVQLQSMMSKYGVRKPLWDTENDWTGQPVDERTAIAYVGRVIILERAAGVSRQFWYEWGNAEQAIHLATQDGSAPSPIGKAYARLQEWLVGSVLKGCTSIDIPKAYQASHAPWTCDLFRNGQMDKIIWNPDGPSAKNIPPSWHVNRSRNLDGGVTPLPSGETGFGIQPLLLEWGQ